MISKLLDLSTRYLQESDWRDLALFKICCIAFGICVGICVKKEDKKTLGIIALVVFALTYMFIMAKLLTMGEDFDFDYEDYNL